MNLKLRRAITESSMPRIMSEKVEMIIGLESVHNNVKTFSLMKLLKTSDNYNGYNFKMLYIKFF